MNLVGGWSATQRRHTFKVRNKGANVRPLARLRLAALDQLPRVEPERRSFRLPIGDEAKRRVALLEHRGNRIHPGTLPSDRVIWLAVAEEYLTDICTRAKL